MAIGLPMDKSTAARLGAFATHSRHDPRETTAAARRTFLARFEDEVDPDHVLPDAERKRRAQFALKLHMAKLSEKAAKAKAKRTRGDS